MNLSLAIYVLTLVDCIILLHYLFILYSKLFSVNVSVTVSRLFICDDSFSGPFPQ